MITATSRAFLFSALLYGSYIVGPQSAFSEDNIIKPENWKSCATRPLKKESDWDSWDSIPKWVQAPHLVKIYEEPRILLNHGLCNEKFKRIVLCLLDGMIRKQIPTIPSTVCAGR